MRATISVVIPVYDEHENLEALMTRLRPVLDHATKGAFEVIFVDDGSRDGSSEMLDEMSALDGRFKVIHFSRNFGHQAALQAGLDATSGRAVALMDADLQDPPEVLGQFIEKWNEGYEVVYAVRKNRKESMWKRAAYKTFYRTMRIVAEIDAPLDSGDFCLMDYKVVQTLSALRERNRFLRGLRSWVGFKQTGIEYERGLRNAGEPKYTVRKLFGLAFSGYIGFSSLPLRISAWIGLLSATAGFAMAAWAILSKLFEPHVPQGWASTIAVVLLVSGVQLVMLGVIGEYLGRVYDEVRQRPLYIISSKVGFSDRQELFSVGADRIAASSTI
jgi:glycosyltransferase involved in cell wall biosynthesis